MHSIIDHFDRWVAAKPDAPLYSFLDGMGNVAESYSYRQFAKRTDAVAAALAESVALEPGERVLLVYPPGLDFIVAFFACAKIGLLPVPIQPPDASGFAGGLEKLSHIMRDAGTRIALTNAPYQRQLAALTERSEEAREILHAAPLSELRWIATDEIDGDASTLRRRSHELLFLQYTSGSTQTPRGVMVSHENVVLNGLASLDHDPIGLCWLPHFHDMGLIGFYLYIMMHGGSAVWFSGAHFMKRPQLWFDAITRFRPTITNAPNFAYEYCLREDKVPAASLGTFDLSSLRWMVNAAEPVRASTVERFRAKFTQCGLAPRALCVFYGLAEGTLTVTGYGRVGLTVNTHMLEQNHLKIETPRSDRYNQTGVMSCGKPVEGVAIRIVDVGNLSGLAEDRIGEIWLAGTGKAQGYFKKPDMTAELFNALVAGEESTGGWLRTGDMGFLHDGELFICGRLKDMIISNGRNYYPSDIEAVVERASSKVRPGCVAAFAIDKGEAGEVIAIIAEARRSNDLPDLEQICREVRKSCQVEIEIIALVPHGSVAKTSSGKVARQECRRLWQDGSLTLLACRQRPETATGDAVIEDLLSRFDMDGMDERTLAELGIDSFTLVEISLYIEELVEGLTVAGGPDLESLFDLRILQAITVGELRALLTEIETTGRIPNSAGKRYLRRQQSIERAELKQMRRDAILARDIDPTAATQNGGGDSVLITGATGFVGSYLLASLLQHDDRPILALARGEDSDHAKMRLEAGLQRTGLLDETMRRDFARRVTAVKGDLAQPKLGLDSRGWQRLAAETSALYHCGAEVDYVKSYEAMRGANVEGMEEIIRLAAAGSATKLHLISTTFMFGFVGRASCYESEGNREMAGLNFGYAQTKWVAEQLAYEAAERGLPLTVYRPSLVTASRKAHYVRGDLMARVLAYMIRHGVSMNTKNQISLLPVDICANNIVALSLLDDPAVNTFHLVADDYYCMRNVCELITQEFGYGFDYMDLEPLIAHMNAYCSKEDPLFPLMAFLNHNFRRIERMSHKRYDSRNYREVRALSPLALDEPDLADTVSLIVRFLQREGMVPMASTARPVKDVAETLLRLEPSS